MWPRQCLFLRIFLFLFVFLGTCDNCAMCECLPMGPLSAHVSHTLFSPGTCVHLDVCLLQMACILRFFSQIFKSQIFVLAFCVWLAAPSTSSLFVSHSLARVRTHLTLAPRSPATPPAAPRQCISAFLNDTWFYTFCSELPWSVFRFFSPHKLPLSYLSAWQARM